MQMDLKVGDLLEYSSMVRPYGGQHVSGDTVVIRPLDNGLFVGMVTRILIGAPDGVKDVIIRDPRRSGSSPG